MKKAKRKTQKPESLFKYENKNINKFLDDLFTIITVIDAFFFYTIIEDSEV